MAVGILTAWHLTHEHICGWNFVWDTIVPVTFQSVVYATDADQGYHVGQ